MNATDALSIKSADGFVTPVAPVRTPARRRRETVDELWNALVAGDRGALSRAITVIESTRDADQDVALDLMDRSLAASGRSARIGITGAPGVGKSTLIEALGLELVRSGSRPAVLTIDPSSPSTGGSILGDKSRMPKLSVCDQAYIRPSANAARLGGVAGRTREAIQLCEAAGFDVVIVETVGVGQSEIEVREMVDCFVLLALPGAGDELQGIKRGIMETADVIALTKADGDNRVRAEVSAGQIERALMMSSSCPIAVRRVSAVEREGIAELWASIQSRLEDDHRTGEFERRRRKQSVEWMERLVRESVVAAVLRRADVRDLIHSLTSAVASGELSARRAAREVKQAVG